MAIVRTDDTHYTAIADAIRNKNGAQYDYKPAEMAPAIEALTVVSGTIQKYYTGSSDPASSLGNDGDLYLKVVG